MTDENERERPPVRHTIFNPNPVAALRREELKYAYRSRRDTPAIRANRKLFEDQIAAIEPEPVADSAGQRLEIAERYRRKRPAQGCPNER
jgi:hypothetical protein